MALSKKKNSISYYCLLVLLYALLLSVSAAGGYLYAVKPLRQHIIGFSGAATLGWLLDEEQEKAIANTYYDKQAALKELDSYSWYVPTIMSPFVGHGCRPGQHNNAAINSLQFRDSRELTLPKPRDVYRIFLTGGSTAYSSGAPRQDRTIGAYLERMLNRSLSGASRQRYEVFTMATPAWASTHERIMIENRLSEWEPDLVISFSGNNDVHWGVLGRNILWFRSYEDEFSWNIINTAYRLSGLQPLPDIQKIVPEPIVPALVAERLLKNIQLGFHALALKNVPYIFCLQPTLAASKKALTRREQQLLNDTAQYYRDCYRLIDAELSNLAIQNFYYCNLAGIFDDLPDSDEIFIDSFHFGDRGNERAARHIFNAIHQSIQ
ncbi:hypothetical protein ACFL43_01210 [Thermodesulfobacteriota bacterium]